jgi:hypothetical protein
MNKSSGATPKTLFISDLHLLANRSHAHCHFEKLIGVASGASDLILGGDIFDFRWSRFETGAESVQAAGRWIDELCLACPDCRIYYVLGNHDHYGPLIEHLETEHERRSNFDWRPYWLRLDDNIFLHGDAADRFMDEESLQRRRAAGINESRRHVFRHKLYDGVVATRLHVPIPAIVHRPRKAARRLTHYLNEIGQGPDSGVRNVYFGHTHLPLRNFEYEGLRFHNSGSTIKGLGFEIIEVEG